MTGSGNVRKLDGVERLMVFTDGTRIPIADVRIIEGDLFRIFTIYFAVNQPQSLLKAALCQNVRKAAFDDIIGVISIPYGGDKMQHECRITVLETKVFADYQEKYLADPKSGPCPCFKAGDTFLLKRTSEQDDFYHLMNGRFCGEAWDAISRYVYAALQGGSIMRKWTNDDRMMIACCNDGTRPVIFKIERIDIPETEEERQWLEKQNFKNTAADAYTG